MRALHKARATAATAAVGVATIAAMGLVAPTATAESGGASTYLVVGSQGSGNSKAIKAVQAAGANVVADYAKIGVLVVSATEAQAGSIQKARVGDVASTSGLGSILDEDLNFEMVATVEAGASGAAQADAESEPLWGQQWNMPQIDLVEAHAVTTGDSDVVVGVLDSGIAAAHPDLTDRVDSSLSASCLSGAPDSSFASWQPTTSTHGTHVAGTIAASLNGIGVTGVAPGVTLAAVKVVNDDGFIYPEAALCGFMWAAEHGFDLTNNSYFIDPWEFNCRNDARQRPVWQAIQRAIRYSSNQGVLNIASAGNSNVDLQHKFVDAGSPNDGSSPVETRIINGACVDLPAEAPGVVTVSAVGTERLKSYYSSYGQGVVEVAAPGGDTRQPDPTVSTIAHAVLSTIVNTTTGALGYGFSQGTSMASPHVAGVAALAISAHGDMSPGKLATLLQQTAETLPCPVGIYNPRPGLDQFIAECSGGKVNSFYGHGEVNAARAVS